MELLTYATMTNEANAATQRDVDEMPPGSRVGIQPESRSQGVGSAQMPPNAFGAPGTNARPSHLSLKGAEH